jgi:transketolase
MSNQALQSQHPDLTARQMANAIRALAMDAVEKAKSGHPGMPMGMADVATVLYSQFLNFDPSQPDWPNRDRFILSAGHGSMLLYALNYLTGYTEMTVDQLKNFRQMGALTAGHPERHLSAGIEMTTGPLGQGISTAVGFALAERILAARFGDDVMDHKTYVIASDGDLQEGISHEACALAGHLKLNKLIVLWDDNGISIDGPTNLSFTEDVLKRYDAYGWATDSCDGHDPMSISQAISRAQTSDKPVIIACKTTIGYGAPTKAGTSSSHGSPLGADEIKGTREALIWPHTPFDVPSDIFDEWREVGKKGAAIRKDWEAKLAKLPAEQAATFKKIMQGGLSADLSKLTVAVKQAFLAEKPSLATRASSGKVLETLVPALPEMIGGSADLTGSNNTKIKGPSVINSENNYHGQYIHYGVREHGMAAVMNGMGLHGGIIPYGGTFLCFADYSRPSIRLAALMKSQVIHVLTHDSIGLGEDGPTHQPVEHLAALRAIPNCEVFRPADAIEAAECWEVAINRKNGPSLLVLTRQNLPTLRDDADATNKTALGAYILQDWDAKAAKKVTIYASGSEVAIAVDGANILRGKGYGVRVVSVPCLDRFMDGDKKAFDALVKNDSIKVAVEAGIRQGWDALIGQDGIFIGMKSFGESAPYELLYKHFGITADDIAQAVAAKA